MPHALASFLLTLPVSAAPQDQAVKAELLDYATLASRLKTLATAHPDRCQVGSIGKSREDRDIWYLRITPGVPPKAQPAILIVANLEGPQVFSSGVALAVGEYLSSVTDEKTSALLANTTVYIVPRLNVDAAEARFKKPLFEQETTGRGVDNDRDGRVGEDEPSDVDGDGVIAWMRKLDPKGEWIVDPNDERAMVLADRAKGEHGQYKLYREGRDSDHDELVAEDPLHDTIVNQNFPFGWKEHGEHAGLFPTDEPEARALCEFVITHKDLAMVIAYDALDTLVDKPKIGADGRALPSGWLASDAKLLEELQRRYADTTGNKTKGSSSDEGSFQGWAYEYRGLWNLSAHLWDIPLDAKKEEPKKDDAGKDPAAKDDAAKKPDAKPADATQKDAKPAREPSDDAKRLVWIDSNGEKSRFLPWKSFKHPDLGDVEIGGFAPFARSEPPEKEREALARKQIDFVLGLGAALPRLAIVECSAKDLGAKLFEVKATVIDNALLPLSSAAARRNNAARPANVRMLLAGDATLVAGDGTTLIRELDGSGGRKELRWLVHASDAKSIGIQLDSDNAGTVEIRPEVKQ